MKKTRRNGRKWLNLSTSYDSGAVQWSVDTDRYIEHNYIDATFSLWDCGRKVSLNLDVYDSKEFKMRMNKLNILIDELTTMKQAMIEAEEVRLEKEKKYKEKERKEKGG